MRDGLSSNKIYCCAQDARGFIWAGTDNGVCRYDGARFTSFIADTTIPGSLMDNIIYSIYPISKDVIFFISYIGSLISYDYRTGRFANLSARYALFDKKFITSLFFSSDNALWLTTNDGLVKTDTALSSFKEYLIPDRIQGPANANQVNTMYEDRNGIFWLGMFYRGLMRFNPRTGVFIIDKNLPISSLMQVKTIVGNRNSNDVYVGTLGEGMYKFNVDDLSYTHYLFAGNVEGNIPGNQVNSLTLQNHTALWIGTTDGLANMDIRTGRIQSFQHVPEHPSSIANNLVNHIFIDRQQNLWVSTFGGIGQLATGGERFIKISRNPESSNTLSSDIIRFVHPDKKGNLWIGTAKGLNIYDPQTARYYHYPLTKSWTKQENDEVLSFYEDRNGYYWFGTWGGGGSRCKLPADFSPGQKLSFTNFYNDTTDVHSVSSNFIRCFAQDKKGNLYLSTWNGGLNRIKFEDLYKEKIRFDRFPVSKDPAQGIATNYIDQLAFDADDNLWMTNGVGLQRVNFEKNEYRIIYALPGVKHSLMNTAVGLIIGKDNVIWCSNWGGLFNLRKTDNDKYTISIPYHNERNGIYSLIQDSAGRIWFSTVASDEIGYYDPVKNETKFFSMPNEVDGYEFYLGPPALDDRGRLYFVGNSGFIKFDPNTIRLNDNIPDIYITAISVSGHALQLNCDPALIRELELNYSQRNLVIQFAALNFISSEQNRYKYRLEGQDTNWVDLGSFPEINFANLEPGDYMLRIIGSNNDGIWNRKGTALRITIAPPFWATNYFRAAIIALLLALIFVFFNNKVKMLRKEREQQNAFSRLLIESQEEERKRLSNELHDSLGQNLLVVKNWLTLYLRTKDKDEKDLEKISELVQEAVDEVKEVSSLLHPRQLENLGLSKAVRAVVLKIENSTELQVESELDDIAGLLTKEEEINLFRIIQESLNNVIKHAEATSVSVSLKRSGESVRAVIRDNGKGFDFDSKNLQSKFASGLGLKSLRERAKLLGSDIAIESAPMKGTTISLTIKLKERH